LVGTIFFGRIAISFAAPENHDFNVDKKTITNRKVSAPQPAKSCKQKSPTSDKRDSVPTS
jgi:hypothetical protein